MQEFGKLRNIRDAELKLMLSWRNAPNVRKNMYTRHEISLDEHLLWWASVQKNDSQEYLIFEQNGEPLGVVGFGDIDSRSMNASWAFYASPDAPKGTGSKMEFLALEYAFKHLGLHKLYCEVLAFNTPVIRLHEKYGFQVEGIMREHHKLDDAYVDIYKLGILSPEWVNKRQFMLDRINTFL